LLEVECECAVGRAGKLCQLLQVSSAPSSSLPRLEEQEEEEDMQSDQGGLLLLPTLEQGVLEFDGKTALRIPNRITKRCLLIQLVSS